MARKSPKYTVTGAPRPLGEEGHGLKIDSKSGQIISAIDQTELVPRKIRLTTYNLDGDENEVLARIKSGGGPNSPVQKTIVTRKRYREIIDRIISDVDTAHQLSEHWRSEAIHFLNGADEPLLRYKPYAKRLQKLCDPNNEYEAALIQSILGPTIECQIVELVLKPSALEEVGSICRELASVVDDFTRV